MDHILKEHERLEKKANLRRAIDDVQVLITSLKGTRNAISQKPASVETLLDIQFQSASKQFDQVNNDLKEIYGALGKYGKALEKKFKERSLPFAEQNGLASHAGLVNRAIAMHLLREGHFDVAAKFVEEVNASAETTSSAMDVDRGPVPAEQISQERLLAPWTFSLPDPPNLLAVSGGGRDSRKQESLQQQFQEMYSILNSLRHGRDLGPAISWAMIHSDVLEARGSNLLFDLCQLQFLTLFNSGKPVSALTYARDTFANCPERFQGKICKLMGALAFKPNLEASPYKDSFGTAHPDPTIEAAAAFTAEFCALLSLSSSSPLFTAVTAGCIALPTLLKLSQIQALHRTSWTTASELPVEVPLPPAYRFHNVFVCPVSKEQSTDANPPMMMPCFHVICKESLERVSRGGRFKCPYCPAESHKNDAKRVFV